MESRPVRRIRGRWILLALVMGAAATLLWRYTRPPGEAGAAGPQSVRVARIVPDSVRIRTEVLNGTDVRGLARRGTFALRDLGFDVVGTGNSSEKVDSSVVYVHSGRMDWGELAARALGGARVVARPDSSRYLDLTVVLGRAWRPPAETFHP